MSRAVELPPRGYPASHRRVPLPRASNTRTSRQGRASIVGATSTERAAAGMLTRVASPIWI
jgi:hypothetical protein